MTERVTVQLVTFSSNAVSKLLKSIFYYFPRSLIH